MLLLSGSEGMMTRRAIVRSATALAMSIGSPLSALADGPMTLVQFRDEVAATLRARRPNLHFVLPDDPQVVYIGKRSVYLSNLYEDCAAAPRQVREAQIVDFFDTMTAGLDEAEVQTFAAAKPRLRGRIVSAEVVASGPGGDLALVTRPFSRKTLIAYVVDSPKTMAYVSKKKLVEWSVTAEAIHTPSIENLDAISRDLPIEPRAPKSGDGLFAVIHGVDGYAAARLLAPKFMARMADELGAELFVSVPQRDLLLAWSVDCADKRRLAEATAHFASYGSRRLSDEIFVWSQEGVRPANPLELVDHGKN